MTKVTLQDVRNEQSAANRKFNLQTLAGLESDAKQYTKARKAKIATTEKNIANLQAQLEQEKANLVEIEARVAEFIKLVEAEAAKDVLEYNEYSYLYTDVHKLRYTDKEVEAKTNSRSAYAYEDIRQSIGVPRISTLKAR